MSRKALGNPTCPRCGWPTRKNGHQPGPKGERYQNYRCTNPDCRRQFQPERPREKKEPYIRCPVCGRAMEVYKVRATYVRYRCTGRRKCHHKLNLPTGLTPKDPVTGLDLMEYGPFQFQRMRYSEKTVAIALYFSVYVALPATTTATILKDLFSVSPSADTILIWTKKAALCLYRELGQVELPGSGKVHIDETFLFHNRHKVFWASRDPVHRLVPAWFFSSSRDTLAAFNFLRQLGGNGQGLTVVSDGLPAYRTVVPIVLPGARHIVYKGFDHLPNNNAIERQHGWLKAPLRAFWGIKSDTGIWAYALNRILTYNFLIPQKALGDKTPAEHAGLGTYRKGSPWQSLMYYVFKASYGVA